MNIIEMAKEAGIPCFAGMYVVTEPAELERFAALVRAERDKDYLQLESDFSGKFDASKDNIFVAIKAIATGVYEL